jgi:hypothetical protein
MGTAGVSAEFSRRPLTKLWRVDPVGQHDALAEHTGERNCRIEHVVLKLSQQIRLPS